MDGVGGGGIRLRHLRFAGAAGGGADAAALARTVDAVLLVTPPDIDRAELTSAVRELQSVDARLIGVAPNEIVGRFDRREPAKTSSVKEPRG